MAQIGVMPTAPVPETSAHAAHAERDSRTEVLFAAMAKAPDARSKAVVVEKVIVLYLDLCTSMASRYDGRGVEHDDLVQVARLALVKAVDRYVPGQGPSFAAFAVPTISAVRGAKHDEEDPSLWADAWPDQALVEALQSPTDYDAVFEYGLNALLAPLRG